MTAFPTVHTCGLQYGALPDTAAQEHLSQNYVRAVATAARCSAQVPDADFEGIDMVFKSLQMNHPFAFPEVMAQLKCTQQANLIRDDYIAWQLRRVNYDQLRVRVAIPRILIVMHCPPDFTAWLRQDAQSLSLSHAAYWVSLRDMDELEPGQKTTTVRVPLSQAFTVEALLEMMDKTGRGALL